MIAPGKLESLVLIEHDGRSVKSASLHAITLAQQLGGSYGLLVIGRELEGIASSLLGYGAAVVCTAGDPALEQALADRYSLVVESVARAQGATAVIGASSTFTKDLLPRVAGLMEIPMITDVMAVETRDGDLHYRRPIVAGNAWATVTLAGAARVLTARAASFEPPAAGAEASPIEAVAIDPASLAGGMEFVAREENESHRPDPGDARVVIGGGRPLKDAETFEKLIGTLADLLGGAAATTRAAVDSGIAPNDLQVGQTGKTIAPELYIAAGISGAIQHLAGIRDSRVIVAINKDADAPIFAEATYGLVGDLYEIIPELIESLRGRG